MSAQYPTTSSHDNAMQNNPQGRSGSASTDAMPFAQRLTCTIAEACKATGLGRTKLYELIGGGYLDTITIGRRRLVRVTSLLSLVTSNSDSERHRAAR
jgi:excisionase family DNA binding protein